MEDSPSPSLHNNDGESKLLPDGNSDPGVARFVGLMKQLQAGASGTGLITLTSGDNFLASQELGVSLGREGPLYDSIALSGIYDAMALGNHDFDLGPEVTRPVRERLFAAGHVPLRQRGLLGRTRPAGAW